MEKNPCTGLSLICRGLPPVGMWNKPPGSGQISARPNTTLTLNEVSLPGNPELALPLLAVLTKLQNRAFELLNIDPARMLPCI